MLLGYYRRLAALERWLPYYRDQTGFILPRMLMLCIPRYVILYIRMQYVAVYINKFIIILYIICMLLYVPL